ncbi:2-oxoglutarate and iron-dependent oxygenase domain-containing protein [Pseudomonas sp. 10B1]|uniref:isopenicillin N synthase family dioxygenase n=1 Tax=unclassified Pseudomonas TaxID=196821 RepID=UPI002AB545C8|nr:MULTISPECIES: 2-oxoglutarate and iron-dependent oxygenase domain-containing protein [unclassified Pseudomonas]MDY7560018.1 2-oxoglutarate and iron-dependent oxygenase domain-containing protein [Pseudomonas sp. AB6]MEA9997102.1 2-oxoglutarate and iron-dependent oxygenase domain-containing protein [Pseudomonas sp. AA4]MEB0089296.1 2-oxoglutarate and iron-dependent oxygenase domain-containing protein [Pseudomonas sp. RTI1]MEB0128461.1 2-oxoglutarate and iron-dependent oxygenase domain-containin
MTSSTNLPLIDMSGVREGDQASIQRAGDAIRQACCDTGFFYIVNHGVPQAVIDRAMAAAAQFFAYSAETKRQVAVNKRHRGWHALGGALMYEATKPDLKEFFSIGLELPEDDPSVLAGEALRGPNQWPAFMPELQAALGGYYVEIGKAGADLLVAVAAGLGIESDFFSGKYRKPLQRTQMVYYPPHPPVAETDQFGVAPHTDYGCITLLYQDNSGGLQVRELSSNSWIDATPIPGSLVVNVGDLLARWSNNRFSSTLHRVINTSGHERYSIATFFDPTYSAVVDPCDLGMEAASSMYPPVAAGDYILKRIDDSMAYRKKV